LTLLLFSCKKNVIISEGNKIVIYHILKNDTAWIDTIDYINSITEDFSGYSHITFTDSMLWAWNQASIKNITRDSSNYMDDCTKTDIQYYQQADNMRLWFCKQVLNNGYIWRHNDEGKYPLDDFGKGFYIVEREYSGNTWGKSVYLIKHERYIHKETPCDKLAAYFFDYSTRYQMFLLRNINKNVDKEKFLKFYNNFRKQDGTYFLYLAQQSQFNVTYFHGDSIESYISGCTINYECLEQFEQLVEE